MSKSGGRRLKKYELMLIIPMVLAAQSASAKFSDLQLLVKVGEQFIDFDESNQSIRNAFLMDWFNSSKSMNCETDNFLIS